MRYRPPLKVLCYGEPGSWKSSFIKTFPKPLLVWMADPAGKDAPYMKDYSDQFLPSASVGDIQHWDLFGDGRCVIPYRDIMQEDGLIRIEYYHEPDIRTPRAASAFYARLSVFYSEFPNWASLGIDSLSAFELIFRKEAEYVTMSGDKFDRRHWGGKSSHDLEELLMVTWPSYPMNVVVTSHVHIQDTGEIGGELVRLLSLPGQLKKTAGRAWSEFYRSYIGPSPADGSATGLLQTRPGLRYHAATQINAPNPCEPYFWELWKGYPDD